MRSSRSADGSRQSHKIDMAVMRFLYTLTFSGIFSPGNVGTHQRVKVVAD
jgi:hypothetical protein